MKFNVPTADNMKRIVFRGVIARSLVYLGCHITKLSSLTKDMYIHTRNSLSADAVTCAIKYVYCVYNLQNNLTIYRPNKRKALTHTCRVKSCTKQHLLHPT